MGFSLLCAHFLQLHQAGAALELGTQASTVVASCVAEHGSRRAGSRVQLWHTGLVAPRHVESSRPGTELTSPCWQENS